MIFVFGVFSVIKMFKQLPGREAYVFKRIPISGKKDNYAEHMLRHKVSVVVFFGVLIFIYFWLNSISSYPSVFETLLKYWTVVMLITGTEILSFVIFLKKEIKKTKYPAFYKGAVGKILLAFILFYFGGGIIFSAIGDEFINIGFMTAIVLAKMLIEYFEIQKQEKTQDIST